MNTATFKAASLATTIAAALALGACTVEKTQEGEMPKVDVQAEGGQLPKYDVDAADVEVTTKPAEVTVPNVDVDVNTREATVQVPEVEVTTPAEKDGNQ